jgi:serine/threonine-protein kinase
MGEVWEAQNIALDAPVAVKLIRTDLDEASAAQRLMQEARAAAKLGHPAIVHIFDVGETSFKDPFIVMERLRGESLGALTERQGRLAAVSAVQILLSIADALATAHLQGIIHRDIKPDNIYIAEDANGLLQPKLVDFGVVKLEHAESDSNLTGVGTVVGSPGYLSPEQARGREDIDYRVDVWAFSVVLYEVITGECPFNGGNYNALLRSIVEDEPRPTTQHAAGDPELWSIIERGLRKDKEERWPSMLEYGRALAQWALDLGVEEDVCGTGLEQKWITTSRPARATLTSFSEFEANSAVRRARLVRQVRDSVPTGNAPPKPDTIAPPPQRRNQWLVGGALFIAACAAGALAIVNMGSAPGAGEKAATESADDVAVPAEKPAAEGPASEKEAQRAAAKAGAAPGTKTKPPPAASVPELAGQATAPGASAPVAKAARPTPKRPKTPRAAETPQPAASKAQPETIPKQKTPKVQTNDLKSPY